MKIVLENPGSATAKAKNFPVICCLILSLPYPDSGLEEVGSLYHPVLYTEEVLSIANTELSPPLLSAKAGRKLDLPRKFKLWFIFVLKEEG